MDARLVKVCSQGLTQAHLGQKIDQLRGIFHKFSKQFGFNVCGEGGEYETTVFDCPLFKTHRIVAKRQEVKIHEDNPVVQVVYLQYPELAVEEKSAEEQAQASQIMEALIEKGKEIPLDHLDEEVGQLPALQF